MSARGAWSDARAGMLSQLRNLLEVRTTHLADKRSHVVMDEGTMPLKAVLKGKRRRTKLARKRSLIQMHRFFVLAQVPCYRICSISLCSSDRCLCNCSKILLSCRDQASVNLPFSPKLLLQISQVNGLSFS